MKIKIKLIALGLLMAWGMVACSNSVCSYPVEIFTHGQILCNEHSGLASIEASSSAMIMEEKGVVLRWKILATCVDGVQIIEDITLPEPIKD